MEKLSFDIDRSLRIRSWNDDLRTFTGTDASNAIGRRYTELFPPFVAMDRDAVAAVFSGGRAVRLKQCAFRCLHRHQQADIRIAPLRSAGQPVRLVQVELSPSDPCAAGRPAAIDGQKLIAIGKIAATLAHGVRNPLNAIKGAVVYLRDRYAHETTLVEFTDILGEEIARLETFISRFLNTTDFESDIAPVDVNELVRRVTVFISLQASAHRIRCDHVLAEVPRIEISAFHLQQALLNVINNAIESMADGGTLTIRTSLRPGPPAPCLALEVEDTGGGIGGAPDGSQQRRPGRGFGLFIADEIVKYYHGRLQISGGNGGGTTVAFLLPVGPAGNGAQA